MAAYDAFSLQWFIALGIWAAVVIGLVSLGQLTSRIKQSILGRVVSAIVTILALLIALIFMLTCYGVGAIGCM